MNDLSKKTCKELREIAKGFGITGRWEMTKDELIKAIENVPDWSDEDIEFETDCIIKQNSLDETEGSQMVKKTSRDYLNIIKVGTLVAFKRNEKDIAMSGKFVEFDEHDNVMVMSKKGTLFKLRPENIIWVKTGTRWPKWVFNLFSNTKSKVADKEV